MNGIAKIVSPLLLASFLFSHCDFFSIAARYLAKSTSPTDGVCVNPDCCCDHDGPGGSEASCGMCTTGPAPATRAQNEKTCCLFAANCDPTSGLPVLSVNKDLQPVKTVNRNFNFVNVEIFRPLENRVPTFDFKADIFHPPQV